MPESHRRSSDAKPQEHTPGKPGALFLGDNPPNLLGWEAELVKVQLVFTWCRVAYRPNVLCTNEGLWPNGGLHVFLR